MYNTNLAFKEEINELPVLDYLFNELKDVFNLSEAEFNKMLHNFKESNHMSNNYYK